ncbi:MAG: hypothetical protein HW383_253 [Candidatus Magasanikbacteria bacterium]|nr:hypothetical protein [Candidatus Magasanikbacteria bacterium]
MNSVRDDADYASTPGFPIRTSTDHRLLGISPWLIAPCNVLRRRLIARHPPYALVARHSSTKWCFQFVLPLTSYSFFELLRFRSGPAAGRIGGLRLFIVLVETSSTRDQHPETPLLKFLPPLENKRTAIKRLNKTNKIGQVRLRMMSNFLLCVNIFTRQTQRPASKSCVGPP